MVSIGAIEFPTQELSGNMVVIEKFKRAWHWAGVFDLADLPHHPTTAPVGLAPVKLRASGDDAAVNTSCVGHINYLTLGQQNAHKFLLITYFGDVFSDFTQAKGAIIHILVMFKAYRLG